MAKGDYKISDIYQGGYSSLASPSNGYMTAGSLGMTTDFRTANILQEVSTKISSGIKNIEVTAIQPEVFDSIPTQQLKEVNRLAKLTGVDITLHGPLIEASGINQQGGFTESERETAERKIKNALLRSHDLNPNGNIPVTFHSSVGVPGSQLLPPSQRTEEAGDYKKLIAINRETGRMAPLESEIKYYPGIKELKKGKPYILEEGKPYIPEERLKILNGTEWDNSLNQVFFNQERAQEILGKNQVQIQHLLNDLRKIKEEKGEIDPNLLSPKQKQAYTNFIAAENYLQDIHQQVNGFFSKAYEFGDDHQKNELKKLNEEFKLMIEKNGADPFAQAESMKFLVNELKEQKYTPKMYVPVEDFAIEKSSQTYGNAAYGAYKKFKDKSPILVIENPPAGGGLSTGEDIKDIVVASRKQFVDNAVKEGMSKSDAERQAEKFIGATWDVGHINMLRGQGYSEKDIIKETETVAPYVKHVHLSDNFGFEHTELPMGMGNVPIKEMMEKLGEKGFEAKKIIEAGTWWQHFKTQPFQETLEAVGSPLYSMHMAPYWSQAPGLYQGYHGGLDGQWLPQINYETFGTSFARLPKELGGQSPGAQGSRMSGRPMA